MGDEEEGRYQNVKRNFSVLTILGSTQALCRLWFRWLQPPAAPSHMNTDQGGICSFPSEQSWH